MREIVDMEEYFVKRWIARLMEQGMSYEEAEAEAWRRVEKMHMDLMREGAL